MSRSVGDFIVFCVSLFVFVFPHEQPRNLCVRDGWSERCHCEYVHVRNDCSVSGRGRTMTMMILMATGALI